MGADSFNDGYGSHREYLMYIYTFLPWEEFEKGWSCFYRGGYDKSIRGGITKNEADSILQS